MIRARRKKPGRASLLSTARLAEMIEAATVDAYGESEQTTGWFTVIDQNLAVPFETIVLGAAVTVERVDLNGDEQIVAICTRGRTKQAIAITDLFLPAPATGRRGVDRGVPAVAPG